jgi:pilus assembly protein CpaB
MGAKIWVPLALSLVLGLGAALLAGKMLKAPHAAHSASETAVAVAARDIDPGTELSAADLTTINYPAKGVPADAVTDPGQLVGRVTVASMLKGQLASQKMLAAAGMPAGLQALVPPGMRAITLEINEFSGLGGMLTPGQHVDVIANIGMGAGDDRIHDTGVRTIVQDLQVLAVGRQLGAPSAAGGPTPMPNSATVLVTPKQAQAIQLVSQGARPWLVLRGYHDVKSIDPGVTSLMEMRGLTRAPAKLVADQQPALPAATQPAVAIEEPAQPRERVMTFIFGDKEQRFTVPAEKASDDSQVTKINLESND